jgi:hypothetical protein
MRFGERVIEGGYYWGGNGDVIDVPRARPSLSMFCRIVVVPVLRSHPRNDDGSGTAF